MQTGDSLLRIGLAVLVIEAPDVGALVVAVVAIVRPATVQQSVPLHLLAAPYRPSAAPCRPSAVGRIDSRSGATGLLALHGVGRLVEAAGGVLRRVVLVHETDLEAVLRQLVAQALVNKGAAA